MACVDIGGTKIAVSVADPSGIRSRISAPTIKQGGRDALAAQELSLLAASCREAALDVADVSALGVASCGPFVIADGQIELAAPNICGGLAGPARGLPNDWLSVPLEAPLRQAFKNVRIENDGIAALEAERSKAEAALIALYGLENP